jgi:hypothetical protein
MSPRMVRFSQVIEAGEAEVDAVSESVGKGRSGGV